MDNTDSNQFDSDTEDLRELLTEFFIYLDLVEISENGHEFHPNQFDSCRAIDGHRMNEILIQLRKWCHN